MDKTCCTQNKHAHDRHFTPCSGLISGLHNKFCPSLDIFNEKAASHGFPTPAAFFKKREEGFIGKRYKGIHDATVALGYGKLSEADRKHASGVTDIKCRVWLPVIFDPGHPWFNLHDGKFTDIFARLDSPAVTGQMLSKWKMLSGTVITTWLLLIGFAIVVIMWMKLMKTLQRRTSPESHRVVFIILNRAPVEFMQIDIGVMLS